MVWASLDDGFCDHPKVEALSDAAFRLHVAAICYCARLLTDGHVSLERVPRLVRRYRPKLLAELVDGGVWHRCGHRCASCPQPAEGSVYLHDFLAVPNRSKAQVQRDRENNRRSKELHSDPALVAAIRERDGDRCRYCGREVNWKDRRGAGGATYDHVDPKGGNSLDNVVVACRACNSRKMSRTPVEAAMHLVPIQVQSQNGSKSDLGHRTQPPLPSAPLVSKDLSDTHVGGIGPDDEIKQEARRRLSLAGNVRNPDAWLTTVEAQLRREGWKPPRSALPDVDAVIADHQVPEDQCAPPPAELTRAHRRDHGMPPGDDAA